jgi:PhoH-like ATPase
MRKTYIIDTSVLVYDPNSYQSFAGNDVIIPIYVLDELDKLKTLPNDAGRNARVFIRTLDKLCQQGELHRGIRLDNDIFLKIDTSQVQAEVFGSKTYVDNKILACAKRLADDRKDYSPVVVVSRDINLRIRARAFEMQAEDYETAQAKTSDLYLGFRQVVNEELGLLLQANGYLDCKLFEEFNDVMPNECLHFVDEEGGGLAIARRVNDTIKLIPDRSPWELSLRNKEQAFAADLLCDPRIPLVTLVGRAGTGKTLCAVASGLEMVLAKKAFNRLVIYRPIQPVGNDIGYLPGTMEEKLDPWMGPIKDSLDFLTGKSKKGGSWKDKLSPQYAEKIEMQALTYVRGRSIPNAFIIVDEAQNLTKEEVKTILTRASSGTKVVLTGDIEQIDNSSLDATNNGLSYVIEKFKDSELAGHITFSKGERSALAAKAAEIL